MITNNVTGAAISNAFKTAVASGIVGYDLQLWTSGAQLDCTIMRLSLSMGGGGDSGESSGFNPGGTYSTRMDATITECAATLDGRVLEVRVGVDVGGSYEYVRVATVTVTTARVAQDVVTIEAFGSIAAKMASAELGVSQGWKTASALRTSIQSASGVTVTLGGFVSTSQSVWVPSDISCKAALSALAFALGGFACERGDGSVVVAPFPRTATFEPSDDIMTAYPAIAEDNLVVDGITVVVTPPESEEAEPATYEFGTGRIVLEADHGDEAWATKLWNNVSGYVFRPGTLTIATMDPRVEPTDLASVSAGEGTALVPATSVACTYDGGWFGTVSAPGMSEAAGQMDAGPLSARVDAVVTAADKASAAAAAAVRDAAEAKEAAEQAVGDAADAKAAAEQAQADAASAASSAQSAASDAASAALSASSAASSASSAASSASSAASSAGSAATDAASAASSAQSAASSASSASASASAAATSASAAASDAQTASSAASQAVSDAAQAMEAAGAAQTAAESAVEDAGIARESAESAERSAESAFAQLMFVEDVAGTLQWIQEHATFQPATDTTVDRTKVYFELTGGDYVPIASPDPDANPQELGWYVLDATEAQADYIMSHLAVTSAGLWVLPSGIDGTDAQHSSGYKALLANDGLSIYDGTGAWVTTFGESTQYSPDRVHYIGSDDAYVVFTPAAGSTPATVTIGGRVVMGSGESLSELLSAYTYDHTFVESGGDYIFTASVHKGGIDVTGDIDPDFLAWWLRTEGGDMFLGTGATKTVSASLAGYRAAVVGGLLDVMEATLVDASANGIVDAGGDEVAVYWIREV